MRLHSLLIALLAITTESIAVPTIVREKRCATNIECVREREAIAAANPVPILTDPIQRRIRAIQGSATPTESATSSTSSVSVSESSVSTSSASATSAGSISSVSSSSSASSESSSTSSTSVSTTSSSSSSTSTSPSPSPSVGPIERFFSDVGISSVTLTAGKYDVAAWGAQGGGAEGTGGNFIPGGPGINYNRTVIFEDTYQIMVAVGGIGEDELVRLARISGGGGGGGSFVYTASGIPLIIGGGGGGSSFNGQGVRSSGGIFATAGRGRGGAGGENGMGGGAADVSANVGGGAGFYGSGVPESNPGSGRSRPGFAGGVSPNGGAGGFGGGGAGGDFAGGGGGGYNGGGAGGAGSGAPGGAGGSYAFSSFSPDGFQLVGDTNYFGPGKVYIYGPY